MEANIWPRSLDYLDVGNHCQVIKRPKATLVMMYVLYTSARNLISETASESQHLSTELCPQGPPSIRQRTKPRSLSNALKYIAVPSHLVLNTQLPYFAPLTRLTLYPSFVYTSVPIQMVTIPSESSQTAVGCRFQNLQASNHLMCVLQASTMNSSTLSCMRKLLTGSRNPTQIRRIKIRGKAARRQVMYII